MDAAKRKVIEAAGWKIGEAADFLEMSDQARQLLDTRVKLALAIRHQREALHLSQKQLGALRQANLGWRRLNEPRPMFRWISSFVLLLWREERSSSKPGRQRPKKVRWPPVRWKL